MLVFIYSLATLSTFVLCDRLDLPAFEYIRRFKNPLFLGQCAHRFVQYPEGPIHEHCTFPNRQGQAVARYKEVETTKIISIRDATELIHYIGMCDEKAASYFGLLASGDCIVSEIASKLTFSKKKVATLMYMDHFRPRLKILIPSAELNNIPDEYTHYLNNSYYTENISIGTEEIILVELHFKTPEEAEKAYIDRYGADKMSERLIMIAKMVGMPTKVKVLRLSTAETVFDMKVFKGQYSAMFEATQLVDQYEKDIARIRHEILHGLRTSHLRYGFKAYEIGPISYSLTTVSEAEMKQRWEEAALLQVKAERVYLTHRRYRSLCRKLESPNKYCLLMIQSLREIKRTITGIHTQRRDWAKLDYDHQVQFIREETKTVKLLKTRVNMLAKILKRLKKKS